MTALFALGILGRVIAARAERPTPQASAADVHLEYPA